MFRPVSYGSRVLTSVLCVGLLGLLASAGAASAQTRALIASIGVGDAPNGVATNPVTNRIYVVNQDADPTNTISMIDGASNTVIFTRFVFGSLGAVKLGAVAVNPVTNKVYVTRDHDVLVLDGDNLQIQGSLTIPGDPTSPVDIDVNPLTNRVYVAGVADSSQGSTAGGLWSFNGGSHQQIAFRPAPTPREGPAGFVSVRVNTATGRVYAVSPNNFQGFLAFQLSVLDGVTLGEINSTPWSGDFGSMAVNSTTNNLYFTSPSTGTVWAIDGGAPWTVGDSPTAIDVDEETNLLYVANSAARSVSVIDPGTGFLCDTGQVCDPGSVVSTVDLNPTSSIGIVPGLAVNPTTHRAYVTHQQGNMVSVVGDPLPPATADAGPDQLVTTDLFLQAAVTLVGAGSGPAPLTYEWFVSGGGIPRYGDHRQRDARSWGVHVRLHGHRLDRRVHD